MSEIRLRPLTEPGILMHWRREVLACVFNRVPDTPLLLANERYYAQALAEGSHIAVEAQVDGEPAGCGSICLGRELPSPDNPSGRNAYLMNIYTRPAFRGRGVARAVVKWLTDKALALGCDKIYLETTQAGRRLYTDSGFRPLPDMMIYQK